MRRPAFAHLTGTAMWRHCDFDRTRIAPDPSRVMLALRPRAHEEAANARPWLDAAGSAAVFLCPPDLCADATVVLADPARGLFALAWPRGSDAAAARWRPLPAPRPRARAVPPTEVDFTPGVVEVTPAPSAGIARDRTGRVWLLDRAQPAIWVLAPDLHLLDTLPLPAAGEPRAIVCSASCLAVADGASLLVQPFGGVWRRVTLPDATVAVAADPEIDLISALLPGPKLAVLRRAGLTVRELPELTAPLFLLVTADNTVLACEPRGAPGEPTETVCVSYRMDAAGAPAALKSFGVRGFDGRALWHLRGTVYASTALGARMIYPRPALVETAGSVETFALDSDVFACVWHRVFVDACLPPTTSIMLEAKTADDLPPFPVRRALRPPTNIGGPALPPAIDDPWLPLGSLTADEPGWFSVGLLDTLGPQADIPDPPEQIARPSEEPFATVRSDATQPWPQATLEGLIKAPRGRYIWLRIRLTGTDRRSPAVLALRATFQRPSLLDIMPSYWRADPVSAESTDKALALFEGFVTDTDARITLIRQLADPRLAPPEALAWLASYVAIVFDQRVSEPVRRQLLTEACWIYQRRGTVPGLTRLLSILSQAPVTLVEGFRFRRKAGAFVGDPTTVLGPGLQIGGGKGSNAAEDPSVEALEAAHVTLMLRREQLRAAGDRPCPPEDPPWPIETDPLACFVRHTAHRFTVVLPCRRTDELEAVIEDAIEANKPAHTLHSLCWLNVGFRLGASSMVGLSHLGDTPCFEPGLLGAVVLGANNTLGRYEPQQGWRVGQRITRDRGARS